VPVGSTSEPWRASHEAYQLTRQCVEAELDMHVQMSNGNTDKFELTKLRFD
jgi:hypothetical protein